MARSNLADPTKDLITDDGSVLISVIKGEQLHLNITLEWLSDLSQYTIFSKVVEGDNDGEGNKPTELKTGGIITSLPILDKQDVNNSFILVLPQTLGFDWTVQPGLNKPVYGFIDLEVQDVGAGTRQQIWKPLRGLIEIRYSPTEAGV